jgi:hypothetical protein
VPLVQAQEKQQKWGGRESLIPELNSEEYLFPQSGVIKCSHRRRINEEANN